jgi:FKBP-type peptidyl-prolyl cis-trans isomerase FklB
MTTRPSLRSGALCILLAWSGASFAAEPAQPAAPAMDDAAKQNYALGYRIGSDLKSVDLRTADFMKGLEDGRKGAASALSVAETEAALTALNRTLEEQRAKDQAAAAQQAQVAAKKFLDDNAKQAGVKTTASGLQYKIVEAGTGASPKKSDTVSVHYRGTLIGGTEFDSSYKRGEPATFPVDGVIAGWTEALQMMKEGAKWQLFIPPALAYGDRGPLAGQLLIFDVELLKVNPATAAK